MRIQIKKYVKYGKKETFLTKISLIFNVLLMSVSGLTVQFTNSYEEFAV